MLSAILRLPLGLPGPSSFLSAHRLPSFSLHGEEDPADLSLHALSSRGPWESDWLSQSYFSEANGVTDSVDQAPLMGPSATARECGQVSDVREGKGIKPDPSNN